MIGFPPKGNTIKDQVLNTIIDKIQFLELVPGENITENAIEGEVGASRTPRREAMMLLEMEGLVNIYPQKGTYVALIDLHFIKELLFVRLTLESKVYPELIEKNIRIMPHVEKYLLMQELAVKNVDFKEFIKYDYLFHRELFQLAGHLDVWKFIEGKLIHSTRFRVLGWKTVLDEFQHLLFEHKKIAETIEKGEKEELLTVLERHHDYTLSRYSAILLEKYPEYFTNV